MHLCLVWPLLAGTLDTKTDKSALLNTSISFKYISGIYNTDFDDKYSVGARVGAYGISVYGGTLSCGGLYSCFSSPSLTLSSSGYASSTPRGAPNIGLRTSVASEPKAGWALVYKGPFEAQAMYEEGGTIRAALGKSFRLWGRRQLGIYLAYERVELTPKESDTWFMAEPYYSNDNYNMWALLISYKGHYLTSYTVGGTNEHPLGGQKHYLRTQNILHIGSFMLALGGFYADDNLITSRSSYLTTHWQCYLNPIVRLRFPHTVWSLGVYVASYQKETSDVHEVLHKQGKLLFGTKLDWRHSNVALTLGMVGIELDDASRSLANSKIDMPSYTARLRYSIYRASLSIIESYTPSRNDSTVKNDLSAACALTMGRRLPLSCNVKGTIVHYDGYIHSRKIEVKASLGVNTRHLRLKASAVLEYSITTRASSSSTK